MRTLNELLVVYKVISNAICDLSNFSKNSKEETMIYDIPGRLRTTLVDARCGTWMHVEARGCT